MRRSQRSIDVAQASSAIRLELLNLKEKFDLTDIEYNQILLQELESTHKYMLRYERHGDYGTPADREEL